MKVLLHKTVLVVGTSLVVAAKDLGFTMGFHSQFHHLHITLINPAALIPIQQGKCFTHMSYPPGHSEPGFEVELWQSN